MGRWRRETGSLEWSLGRSEALGYGMSSRALERFCKSCRGLASRHSVFHQVKPFRRGHMRNQTGALSGLGFGVRPPLSDFAFRPTPNFRVDDARVESFVVNMRPVQVVCPDLVAVNIKFRCTYMNYLPNQGCGGSRARCQKNI